MSQQQVTDQEILELWRKDKDASFRLLLKTYQERLYWHVRSLVVTHANANDVCQNAFIKVFRSIDGFKGNSNLYTWMYRIASNESIDFLRKQKRRRTEDMKEHAYYLDGLKAGAEVSPEQIEQILNAALETLPEKQRLVFQLRYFGQKTYGEISEMTDTSIGGLKANYHHAVKRITAYIKEQTAML